MDEIKRARIEWLAQAYSGDAEAMTDAVADQHLFERYNDMGMAEFMAGFRPLTKLREARGPLEFKLGETRHVADDLSFAELTLDDEVVFEVRVRFESAAPHRILYWGSYPPLAPDVSIRAYRPEDAAGCVALERACPMELADGSRWVIDRGADFDEYLRLVAPVDAGVAIHEEAIIGFYSCALRPIRYKGEDTFAVYQHHYRVHPDHRAGSVSQALANFVDPRRTFESYAAQFPYSLVDPNNVHMQNMGFPEAEGVRIARLAVPVSVAANVGELVEPSAEQICAAMDATHGERELYCPYTVESLANRWSRTNGFNLTSYRAFNSAIIGIWAVNELNVLEQGDTHTERRLAFALDYAFAESDDLAALIRGVCVDLAQRGTTHLSFMCDTRAPEYPLLRGLADAEDQFAWHTLPWIAADLQSNTIYCDAVFS